jgi:cellulose biosynthesis protein BcsQ
MSLGDIIDRQYAIANNSAGLISLPKFQRYSICNLRGGVGKTTLAFNLSYLTDGLLTVDTCPQGNLSFFFDSNYDNARTENVQNMILPYLIPGLGKASHIATRVEATNGFFTGKRNYFIRSSAELYLLPSQLITALNQALSLYSLQREEAVSSIIFSLRSELNREMKECQVDKYLIDTSPFFAGATQLAWYASDALIIPVRTDLQSLNSLRLLIQTLTSSQGEFRKYLLNGNSYLVPKIQMAVLTHCGWSRHGGDRNVPDRQTKMYAQKVYDLLSQHRSLLATDDPDNHLFLLDDLLGSGRISSAQSKPIDLLKPGETKIVNDVKVEVNDSVEKCKNQLKYIAGLLW